MMQKKGSVFHIALHFIGTKWIQKKTEVCFQFEKVVGFSQTLEIQNKTRSEKKIVLSLTNRARNGKS